MSISFELRTVTGRVIETTDRADRAKELAAYHAARLTGPVTVYRVTVKAVAIDCVSQTVGTPS
ncbi:MAG: hypothetical protein EBR82_37900 [Caulobacteraceae bacterium]|nr:hypothetical protein [Caulobacteraceae bacterium]